MAFERNEIEFLKKFLRKGDSLIDIGANVGFLSGICDESVGKNGKVFAIEANPETYKHLEKNSEFLLKSNIFISSYN